MAAFLILAATAFKPAQAQTWSSSPGSGDWNTAANWDLGVPNGTSATATFGGSSTSAVTNAFSYYVTLGGMQFNSGASAYTLTNSGLFIIEGLGVVDLSGKSQQFINNSSLVFGNSASTTATSAGDLVIIGMAPTTFTGYSTAGQAKITNQAILEFDTNATAGNSTLTNQFGSVFFINNSSAGQASIVNSASGNVSFGDNSSAASASIVNNGNMNFFDTSTAGNAVITNSGNLSFRVSATAANASLNNTATGTLGFYDSTTGSVASIVNKGNLDFNNNSSAAGAVISNSNILDFNDSSTAGNAQITSSGILNFTGSSTAGAAAIVTNNGGKTVFEPGTSGGNAQFTTNAGGTFDLTNLTTGTLGVGSYTQASGGILKMALFSGTPALLAVGGNAVLGGNLNLVYGGGFPTSLGSSVTILTAGSLSGLFDQWNNPQGGRLFPFYTSNLVYLESVLPTFEVAGLTANQTAIAQALDGGFEDRNRYNLMVRLVNQTSSNLPALYSQMDPAGLTSFYQMGFRGTHAWTGEIFQNLKRETMIAGDTSQEVRRTTSDWFAADMPAAEEKVLATQASKPDEWKGSLDAYGDFETLTGDGNSQGYPFTVGGLLASVQYRLAGDWTAGLCLGYGQGNANPDTGGEEDVNGGQAGLFAAWHDKGFHAEALAGAGLNQYKTQRSGYGGTASANASGEDYTGRIGLGYGFRLDELEVGPFVSAEYTYVQLGAFNESGSLAPLSYPAQGEGALLSDLGLTLEQNIKWGSALLTPGITAAWEHAYQANPDSLTAGLGGDTESFTVQGPAMGQDAVVLGVQLEAAFKSFGTVYGDYHGRIGLANTTEQSLTCGVKTEF